MTRRPLLRAISIAGGSAATAWAIAVARATPALAPAPPGSPGFDALASSTAHAFGIAGQALAMACGALALAAAIAEVGARRRRRAARHKPVPSRGHPLPWPHLWLRRLARMLLGPGCALLLAPSGVALADPAGVPLRPPPVLVPADTVATSGLDPAAARPPGRPAPAPPAVAEATQPSRGPASTHVVRPGEHFWSIAAAVVEAELGRTPAESEVRPTWVALIDANRHRLVRPGHVDLLLPGQELVIPRG